MSDIFPNPDGVQAVLRALAIKKDIDNIYDTIVEIINSGNIDTTDILVGEDIPLNELGKNGDIYIRLINGAFYKRENGIWNYLGTFFSQFFLELDVTEGNPIPWNATSINVVARIYQGSVLQSVSGDIRLFDRDETIDITNQTGEFELDLSNINIPLSPRFITLGCTTNYNGISLKGRIDLSRKPLNLTEDIDHFISTSAITVISESQPPSDTDKKVVWIRPSTKEIKVAEPNSSFIASSITTSDINTQITTARPNNLYRNSDIVKADLTGKIDADSVDPGSNKVLPNAAVFDENGKVKQSETVGFGALATKDTIVNVADLPDLPTSKITGLDNALDSKVPNDDPALTNARPASDVSAWAKEPVKPTYTKTDVGLSNVENKSSATIRGEIVEADIPSLPISKVTNLQSGLDAKVPTSRTVAGKPLSTNVTLGKADVGLSNVTNVAQFPLADAGDMATKDEVAKADLDTALTSELDAKRTEAQVDSRVTTLRPDNQYLNSNVTKESLGLQNVDNTADSAKPVSTAQQAALNNKSNLDLGNINAGGESKIRSEAAIEITAKVGTTSEINNIKAGRKATGDKLAEADLAGAIGDKLQKLDEKGRLSLGEDYGGALTTDKLTKIGRTNPLAIARNISSNGVLAAVNDTDMVRLSVTESCDLQGITMTMGASSIVTVYVSLSGASVLTVKHQSTSTQSDNTFWLPDEADIVVDKTNAVLVFRHISLGGGEAWILESKNF